MTTQTFRRSDMSDVASAFRRKIRLPAKAGSHRKLEVVFPDLFISRTRAAKTLADQFVQATRGNAGAGFLRRQVVCSEHGARRERNARNDALGEHLAQRGEVGSGLVLVERMIDHPFD